MNVTTKKASNRSGSLKVVVVDDSEDCADMLADLLTFLGHTVRVAYHGQDGLELLAQDLPDVVLLDVGLPDLDGYAVAAQIRSRFGERIRLVALTGFTAAEASRQAMDAGFDVLITKPCSAAELENTLVG